jgi:two-component system cell cycle response regulator
MFSPRGLIGVTAGIVGTGAGAAAIASGTTWPAAIAGAGALVAGMASVDRSSDEATPDDQTTAQTAVAELARMRVDLDEERRQHDSTRQMLAEYMASQPPAGSFDRKLNETATPIASTASNGADTKVLSDPETNLFSEAYFRVALEARIASARRHLRPVAVALLQVTEGAGTPGAKGAEPTKVTGAIRQTLRDADTACRMTDGCFALILEDTPENGAVWTVERIRRNLTSRHGHHTMWAGVACYPAHAFSTDELLDQASLALDAAREWKQDRIEVATAD